MEDDESFTRQRDRQDLLLAGIAGCIIFGLSFCVWVFFAQRYREPGIRLAAISLLASLLCAKAAFSARSADRRAK